MNRLKKVLIIPSNLFVSNVYVAYSKNFVGRGGTTLGDEGFGPSQVGFKNSFSLFGL